MLGAFFPLTSVLADHRVLVFAGSWFLVTNLPVFSKITRRQIDTINRKEAKQSVRGRSAGPPRGPSPRQESRASLLLPAGARLKGAVKGDISTTYPLCSFRTDVCKTADKIQEFAVCGFSCCRGVISLLRCSSAGIISSSVALRNGEAVVP